MIELDICAVVDHFSSEDRSKLSQPCRRQAAIARRNLSCLNAGARRLKFGNTDDAIAVAARRVIEKLAGRERNRPAAADGGFNITNAEIAIQLDIPSEVRAEINSRISRDGCFIHVGNLAGRPRTAGNDIVPCRDRKPRIRRQSKGRDCACLGPYRAAQIVRENIVAAEEKGRAVAERHWSATALKAVAEGIAKLR